MTHRSKIKKHKQKQTTEPDILEDYEKQSGLELSKKMHERAEKPTKFPKKIRSSPKESYRPLRKK